jgi:hypothetical protein
MHAYIHTYVYTYIYMYIYVYNTCIQTETHTHTHTHKHTHTGLYILQNKDKVMQDLLEEQKSAGSEIDHESVKKMTKLHACVSEATISKNVKNNYCVCVCLCVCVYHTKK